MSSTPPRFRIESAAIRGDCAHLSGPELHHLRDVMRVQPGLEVELIDEHGGIFAGRVITVDAAHASIRIERVTPPRPAPPLILAVAIIKGPRMDFAIEKAVELGAGEIRPMLCARGVVRDPGRERIARWRRLAIAASKQSRADRSVLIEEPAVFADAIKRIPAGMLPIICHADGIAFASAVARATRQGILVACGPEGDFTSEEISAAESAGFVRANLGRNRLRTETAALAALALASSVLDRSEA